MSAVMSKTLQNDIFMTSKSESDHAATFSRVLFPAERQKGGR